MINSGRRQEGYRPCTEEELKPAEEDDDFDGEGDVIVKGEGGEEDDDEEEDDEEEEGREGEEDDEEEEGREEEEDDEMPEKENQYQFTAPQANSSHANTISQSVLGKRSSDADGSLKIKKAKKIGGIRGKIQYKHSLSTAYCINLYF